MCPIRKGRNCSFAKEKISIRGKSTHTKFTHREWVILIFSDERACCLIRNFDISWVNIDDCKRFDFFTESRMMQHVLFSIHFLHIFPFLWNYFWICENIPGGIPMAGWPGPGRITCVNWGDGANAMAGRIIGCMSGIDVDTTGTYDTYIYIYYLY